MNHWVLRRGSTMSFERSQRPISISCEVDPARSPRASRSATIRVRASNRSRPSYGVPVFATVASSARTVTIGRSWRRPVS
jgi:hypothetical protein